MQAQPETPGTPAGWVENGKALWSDLRGLLADHLTLVTLELQKAAEGVIFIVVYGIVVGVLLASAWLGLTAALVVWMMEHGLATSMALLLAGAFNLVGALAFAIAVRDRCTALRLPATLRSLRASDSLATPKSSP